MLVAVLESRSGATLRYLKTKSSLDNVVTNGIQAIMFTQEKITPFMHLLKVFLHGAKTLLLVREDQLCILFLRKLPTESSQLLLHLCITLNSSLNLLKTTPNLQILKSLNVNQNK